MSEKPPIYNRDGRVSNPDLARKAAEVEDKYHKKTFGLFKSSERKLNIGEDKAERAIEAGRDIMEKGFFGNKIKEKQVPEVVRMRMLEFKKKIGWLSDFDEVTKADIGGGVERYRVYISESGISSSIYIDGLITPLPSGDDYHELVLDVKNGRIIFEEERKDIPK